ncbi:uncharacterized protein LOC127802902 isoform X2 [Diospyros lotus]|uniref:uncharacterized protein LOC127802902 isoform X2 n=1 Tax=Diospyros lotus TaxID=55363 RepID=UPI0022524945|nr:uncharacterized protein LOC127802902 isoform X2 [Diospyros lotus]
MGGKGRRRREKNYRAAHCVDNHRLPPPPDPSSLEAVPSKLRNIIVFSKSSQPGSPGSKEQRNGRGGSGTNKKLHAKDETDPKSTGTRGEGNDRHSQTERHMEDADDVVQKNAREKRKKTKKRKRVTDLRFETLEESSGVGMNRRERKKKRLQERNKRKKAKLEDKDFPRHEYIKFGEVVQGPPKLIPVPKAIKAVKAHHDASQERLRIKAVEAYRNRKGWVSRPGIKLPPPIMTSP